MNFKGYQRDAVSTAIFPQKDGLAYLTLGLTGEAGEVAEKVKKIIRDNGGYLSAEARTELAKEMGDVLWYLANLAEFMGFELEDAAKMNIAKLASRQKRGKLKGSGDNR